MSRYEYASWILNGELEPEVLLKQGGEVVDSTRTLPGYVPWIFQRCRSVAVNQKTCSDSTCFEELTDFQMVVQAPLPTSTRPAVVNLVQLDIIFSRSAGFSWLNGQVVSVNVVLWMKVYFEVGILYHFAFWVALSLHKLLNTYSFWAKLQILADGWQLVPGNCSRPRQHMQLGRGGWWRDPRWDWWACNWYSKMLQSS